jgi:flagellar hook-associated protein 1 FlgK
VGSFDALNTSLSALYAQRRGMDVVGQNVSNANTEGYSRQRVVMQSVGASPVPAIFSTWNGTGGGVTAASVERMRDTFLEERGRAEHANLERANVGQSTYAQLEQLVGEPSDTGLQQALTDIWAGFGDVANNPGDLAARNQLVQSAAAATDWLNSASSTLSSQWAAGRTDLQTLAADVNNAASGVAELNSAIRRATLSGQPANELADQRDGLAMKLAELTGATARPGEDGSLDVYLGGTALVRGGLAETVAVGGPDKLADVSSTAQVALVWPEYDGQPVAGLGGKAGGVTDSLNTVIPGFVAALDSVASGLATTVNGQHAAGYDLDGAAGGAFFTGTTAATIRVAVTDPRKVAAANTPGTLDGSNADRLASLANSATGPDKAYRNVVTNLAVQAQSVNSRVAAQTGVTTSLDDARASQAGVDIDEEMVNMLTYQRAYEGASRMLTAVDQMLDQLINRTGLAGR